MVQVAVTTACLMALFAGALLAANRGVYFSSQSAAGELSLKFDDPSPDGPAVALRVEESNSLERRGQTFWFRSSADEISVRGGELVKLALEQNGIAKSRRFRAVQAGTGASFRFDVNPGEEGQGQGAGTIVPVNEDMDGLDLVQEMDDALLIFFGQAGPDELPGSVQAVPLGQPVDAQVQGDGFFT